MTKVEYQCRSTSQWDILLVQLGVNPNNYIALVDKIDKLPPKQQESIREELERLNSLGAGAKGYLWYLRDGFEKGLKEVI